MLKYRPKRAEYSWDTNNEGLVQIKIPKFTSTIGTSFCKLIKKENIFTAHMDKVGSLVWKQCDGVTTVNDILKLLKKEFPKEKNIDQRLFLFIQQMNNLDYIIL
jgi:hypothetical protein